MQSFRVRSLKKLWFTINPNRFTAKSDIVGIMASGLCFLHCIATPLLFVAYSQASLEQEVRPWWWGSLDIVFLTISFFAVYWSIRNTQKIWIKYAFWFSWTLLSLVLLNEKIGVLPLPEEVIYFPTVGLILFHFYNRRYCQCKDECRC